MSIVVKRSSCTDKRRDRKISESFVLPRRRANQNPRCRLRECGHRRREHVASRMRCRRYRSSQSGTTETLKLVEPACVATDSYCKRRLGECSRMRNESRWWSHLHRSLSSSSRRPSGDKEAFNSTRGNLDRWPKWPSTKWPVVIEA